MLLFIVVEYLFDEKLDILIHWWCLNKYLM